MIFTVLVALATLASADATCGGEFTGTSGEFTSPNYPGNYPSDAYCEYVINPEPGMEITLEFTDFDIEHCSDACTCDYVVVDGGAKMCGDEGYGKTFTSSSQMTVTFFADAEDTTGGFRAEYKQAPKPSPCKSGFELVGGNCVQWLGLRAKYDAAKTKCDDLSTPATLLMLKSESFTNAIMAWDKVTKKTFRNFWVGLDNEDASEGKEKDFTWADGSSLLDGDWVNWKYAPRNGEGHMNKCVGSGADHQEWRRYKCDSKSLYVICQEEDA